MALTNEQKNDATRSLIRKMFVESNATANLDTTQVHGLIEAADAFLEANAAAYNSSIPQPLRGDATADRKALAIAWCALKRAGAI